MLGIGGSITHLPSVIAIVRQSIKTRRIWWNEGRGRGRGGCGCGRGRSHSHSEGRFRSGDVGVG